MNKKLLTLLFVIVTFSLKAQVTVNNTNTVSWYVQNVLLGTNVSVSNITLNGSPATSQNEMVGEFNDPTVTVGLQNGLIIGTGDVNMASQANTGGGSYLGGTGASGYDPDLVSISSNPNIYDECVLEFDFIPNGDSLSFNYIFASEEYEEYVCSNFNDVFGFFLTGTNPAGGTYNSQNIALVPNPGNPSTYTTTAVAINTVNPGVAGANGSTSTCSAIDPAWASYNVFYQPNTTNTYEYDGRTVSLPVRVAVNCGETYHIKLAICDVGDAIYDSGVFLEAGSFSSNGVDATQATAPGNVTLCTTDLTMNFSAGPNPPPYSYWDFGDGSGTSTQPNPSYTYADTGYYQVMYVAIDSTSALCVSTDTAYFDVTLSYPEQFSAQLNIPPPDPCADSMLVHLEFTGTGADSLFWNLGNGDTYSDSTSMDYYYTIQGDYQLTMIAYDFDCNYTDTITDSIHFHSNFTTITAIPPNDTTICSSPPITYTFNAGTNPPPYVYWEFGDGSGNSSTLYNPTYTYADTGSYNVTFVAIDSSTCNIADTTTFPITLTQAEQFNAQFNLPPVDPCNAPDSLLVNVAFTGSGADSLVWNMGNGTTFTNLDSIDYYYTSQGQYIITMTAWDLTCNHTGTFTDTLEYFINYTSVQASVPDSILLCDSPFTVDFAAGSPIPPNNYWDFGDGSGSSTQANPTYTYADTGSYIVMYVAIDSSTCNIADTAYFPVDLMQAEQFSATLDFTPPPPCGSESILVNLAFTGSGADSLIWDMGNGTTFINVDSVTYIYTVPGTYDVSMTAYDLQCNKVQTISNQVVFAGSQFTETIVPNIFTPNGDGENDELKFINVDATQEFSLRIYDRWGVKMFETEDPSFYWNGETKHGKKASEGVYFYELIYTDQCSDESKVKTGVIQLVR